MTFTFDFTKDARRTAIFEQALAALDDAAREQVSRQVAAAVFTQEHYHDIGAVDAAIDALADDVAPARTKADLHAVYGILARAEAQVHGCEVDHTHFHEVGRAAGLRSALAVCLAVEAAVPEGQAVAATPVQTGKGQVECAHGLMDIPAPATKAILEAKPPLPLAAELLEGELCTPTSAALIRHFVTEWVR